MEKRLSINEFKDFKLQLKDLKLSFDVIETTFTKTIILKDKKIIFSDSEFCVNELKLINLVKKDVKNYIENKKNNTNKIDEKDITFYKYYKTEEKTRYAYKIDLTSAYWVNAINTGLLSDETVNFHKNSQFKNGIKQARLKALGSLATKKYIYNYNNGKLINELPIIRYNEDNRLIYLHICNNISLLMQNIRRKFLDKCFYYYWDCLFFEKDINLRDVKQFINQNGYECTIEDTIITTSNFDYYPFVEDIKKNITYPVKKINI